MGQIIARVFILEKKVGTTTLLNSSSSGWGFEVLLQGV